MHVISDNNIFKSNLLEYFYPENCLKYSIFGWNSDKVDVRFNDKFYYPNLKHFKCV